MLLFMQSKCEICYIIFIISRQVSGTNFACLSIPGQVCIIQGVRASPIVETRNGSVAHM